MESTGQPYLRAFYDDVPGPWRSVLSHLPLYCAGLLVMWTLGILNRFSGAQSVSAPALRSVTPTITFVAWLVLLIYTAFLILVAVRPRASGRQPLSLQRRLARTVAPTAQTSLVMGIIQGGEVVIGNIWRGPAPHFGDLWLTALFYALEATIGVAAFCMLFATIAVALSPIMRGWWTYALGAWVVYGVIDRFQRYATFVPFPWTNGSVFHSGLDFGKSAATNVFINGFPGNYISSGAESTDAQPPYTNIDVHNIWINVGIVLVCAAFLTVTALVSSSRTRAELRRSGGPPRTGASSFSRTSPGEIYADESSLIPWDHDEAPPSSRRLGP
ncbi:MULTISPECIES: hypothetical protein [Micrococcaceae]|uniref:hypothetical protein n=1 Tax=unclassified Kocuria TaxID=2649579 RepID=UPI00101381EF|nr:MULTISPECIES: hypothetical protein [unclassified Kocuria]